MSIETNQVQTTRTADTSTPILQVLAKRWSPRSFDPTITIDERALTAALEAARWSPSAANLQPWRFIVARRGTVQFAKIEAALMGFNAAWAGSAGALVVAIAETENADGDVRRWAEYDLGQAMAHFSVQAHSDGLHVHQMGGIEVEKLRTAFDLDGRFVPVSVSAVGTIGAPELLSDTARERELAPRSRLSAAEILIVNA